MTDAGREEVVAEERRRSEEELRAAEALLAVAIPRVAVARAYFALFHMARALLYSVGIEPKTHEGVLQLLGLHFVRSGRLTVADSRTLARLQKFRAEADYGDSLIVDEASAREDLDASRALCATLDRLVGPGR